ncbi:unnamed protein product [Brassica rapa subsp. trilocularis]
MKKVLFLGTNVIIFIIHVKEKRDNVVESSDLISDSSSPPYSVSQLLLSFSASQNDATINRIPQTWTGRATSKFF